MDNEYQLCTRCVMDTTDPKIIFDEEGICNHCRQFETITQKGWLPNKDGARKLQTVLEQIKSEGTRQI